MTEDEFCAKCGGSRQVVWCPAWDVFLCAEHRQERAWKEVDATEAPLGWAEAMVRPVPLAVL